MTSESVSGITYKSVPGITSKTGIMSKGIAPTIQCFIIANQHDLVFRRYSRFAFRCYSLDLFLRFLKRLKSS